MKRTVFKESKVVLIFNGAQMLISIFRSLHSASEFSGLNLQAISFCCTGKYVSSGGFYFRHLHPEIIIGLNDLNKLNLTDYDKMCGETRKYHSVREMAKKRKLKEIKGNNKNKTDVSSSYNSNTLSK